MSDLDLNDPIVRLSQQIHDLLPKHDTGTIIAALASSLGAVLLLGDKKSTPVEIEALQELLHWLVGEVLHARRTTRES